MNLAALARVNPNVLLMEYATRGGGLGGGHGGGYGGRGYGGYRPVGHSGVGHSLATTFGHAVVASLAWHGVSELFRHGHGLGLIIFVVVAVWVVVHFARRRRSW